MKRFQPYTAVVQALRESDLLDVTEDDEVKRKVPLAASLCSHEDNLKIVEDAAMPRSIYAKGFGEESADTQFAIEAFFAPYGPTRAIRLRRAYDRTFKGSVFVEFETEEAARQFLELDPPPKFHQMHLVIKSKKAYCDQKVEDIKAGKVKPNNNDRGNYHNGKFQNNKFQNRNGPDNRNNNYNKSDNRRSNQKGDSRGHDYRKGEDDRDWRIRREEDKKKNVEASKDQDQEAEPTNAATRDGSDSEKAGKNKTDKKRAREEDEEEGGTPPKKAKAEEDKPEIHPSKVGTTETTADEVKPKATISKKRPRDAVDDDEGDDGLEKTPSKKARAEEDVAKT